MMAFASNAVFGTCRVGNWGDVGPLHCLFLAEASAAGVVGAFDAIVRGRTVQQELEPDVPAPLPRKFANMLVRLLDQKFMSL